MANAVFSLFSGLTLIVYNEPIAQLMLLQNNLALAIIGVGLLLFAGALLFTASVKNLKPVWVKGIICMDWCWVAGSVILLILNPFEISPGGNFLIAGVGVMVSIFALWQTHALKGMR